MTGQEATINIITAVLEAIIPIILTFIGGVIYRYLKNKKVSETCADLVGRAYDLLSDCVSSINQTFVESLKNAGEFTPELGRQAKEMCIAKFKSMMTDAMKMAIEALYTNSDEWIDTTLEMFVQMKKR